MREYDPTQKAAPQRDRRAHFFEDQQRAAAPKLTHPKDFDFDALTIPDSQTTAISTKSHSDHSSSISPGATKRALQRLKHIFLRV